MLLFASHLTGFRPNVIPLAFAQQRRELRDQEEFPIDQHGSNRDFDQ
jgi:hypothetical protein